MSDKLPAGCGYSGCDFGATYPDSVCIGGRLYDADNCDDSGNLYEPTDFIPCPECQHEAWLEIQREHIQNKGAIAAEDGQSRESCPFPKAATRYPQDGQWYKDRWLEGYDQQIAEPSSPAAAIHTPSRAANSTGGGRFEL